MMSLQPNLVRRYNTLQPTTPPPIKATLTRDRIDYLSTAPEVCRASYMPGYWPYYCEENVWNLASEDSRDGVALIVSNATQQVLLCKQRAGREVDGIPVVVWDYHVLWCPRMDNQWQIIDPDSTIAHADVGLPLAHYLAHTFPPLSVEYAALSARFKVIPKDRYLGSFASDRRHMRDDTGWLKPPPPWPCIGHGHVLPRLLDMRDLTDGVVVDAGGLADALDEAARQ
ncbi:MAG: hypothetical protein CMQ61_01045 [Gammaproteobacteria bacterium]|nr:hypothetical protein [Gammaproteobacteria bacterium]